MLCPTDLFCQAQRLGMIFKFSEGSSGLRILDLKPGGVESFLSGAGCEGQWRASEKKFLVLGVGNTSVVNRA